MAYRFKLKERLQDGVRRIAIDQLDKVLASPTGDEHRIEWVHQTRKSLKRLRSLLRLVETGLPSGGRRKENGELRRIAQGLSGMRDRDVMRLTLGKLGEAARKNDALGAAVAWGHGLLETTTTRSAQQAPSTVVDAIADASASLNAARDRFASIDLEGDIASVLSEGLGRGQKAGRKALTQLEAEVSDETIHELRKAVQTYQRQHTLVQAVWPESEHVRIGAARALAQNLGEAQDMAVLAAFAAAHRDDDHACADTLVAACRKQQASLAEHAVPEASRLFAVPPKAVATEFARAWHAAARLSRT